LYPNIHTLLANESGISVHMADNADPIAPAIKIKSIKNFIKNLTNLLNGIENSNKIYRY